MLLAFSTGASVPPFKLKVAAAMMSTFIAGKEGFAVYCSLASSDAMLTRIVPTGRCEIDVPDSTTIRIIALKNGPDFAAHLKQCSLVVAAWENAETLPLTAATVTITPPQFSSGSGGDTKMDTKMGSTDTKHSTTTGAASAAATASTATAASGTTWFPPAGI
jgi:hypothetical protein